MRKVCVMLCALCLVLAFSAASFAGQAEEAKALVQKAVAMAKAKGMDAALKAVADKNGPFVKGNLYVFAGKISTPMLIAHPIKPKLVGRNMAKIKDVNGKYFFIEFGNVAKKGGGWVEYHWPKPGEKKSSPKVSYLEAVPGQDVYFGCGYYK